ncbi:MAG TPA: metallophosphoesterase [Bryobacteraceae bacterium]|nr:metallophosphoesterase [Bryobacteraceae bacterium]
MTAKYGYLRRRFLTALLLACIAPLLLGQDTFQGVGRIVAIGDVHGDYDVFVGLLRSAELVNSRNQWTGGKTHLVQTGDVLDRGPASRKVMDLLMQLEPQARKAGGAVHALLGNHEAMNLYGDLRYVSGEEYESYRTADSAKLRDRYFERLWDQQKRQDPASDGAAFRDAFYSQHPLGWVEQREAFGPEGVYGRWLRRHPVIIKINDVLFLHGGISPKYASTSISVFNATVAGELRDFSKLANGMAMDPEGPLWYRGLIELPEPGLAAHVSEILERSGAHHIVIGHTVTSEVLPRFGGKVIPIDVGLSRVFGGPPALLIIEGSNYYVLYRGQRIALPVDGGGLGAYLDSLKTLDEAARTNSTAGR